MSLEALQSLNLSRAMFDIKDVKTTTNILEKFPRLVQYPEFNKVLPAYINKSLLFRYIVLMYDSHLAVHELIPDLSKRKISCAEYAGFPVKDGKVDGVLESVLLCVNEDVNAMIICYCQMQRNHKFTSLVAIEEAHFKLLKKLLEDSTDKSSVLKTINDMEYEIEQRTLELLNYDKSFYLYNSLYEKTEMERLALRPEDIAYKLKLGIPVVDVAPYGKKYAKKKYTKEDVKRGRKKITEA